MQLHGEQASFFMGSKPCTMGAGWGGIMSKERETWKKTPPSYYSCLRAVPLFYRSPRTT